MLGFTSEELAGGLATWVELIHPDDRAAFECESGTLVEEKIPFRLQYRVRRKDGALLVVEDNGHFVLGQTGRSSALSASSRTSPSARWRNPYAPRRPPPRLRSRASDRS